MNWLLLLLLLLAVLLPLATILSKALTGDDGHFVSFSQITRTLAQPGFVTALAGSLKAALATTLLVVPLAYGYAYGASLVSHCLCVGCSGYWHCFRCWHHRYCPVSRWFICLVIRVC
ncbi:hypothetical protein [Paludibacterium denitrificans]|uniref:hypothetical protein n=1 Tax=Paludibacterium denitrificans TaxID=2675226 RepID=UPI001E608B3D|nr:hypothetical protein [Paludibacterium denitrificans]